MMKEEEASTKEEKSCVLLLSGKEEGGGEDLLLLLLRCHGGVLDKEGPRHVTQAGEWRTGHDGVNVDRGPQSHPLLFLRQAC